MTHGDGSLEANHEWSGSRIPARDPFRGASSKEPGEREAAFKRGERYGTYVQSSRWSCKSSRPHTRLLAEQREALMPMTTKAATHYGVACSRCGTVAEICPQRQTDLDVWLRAVRAFERAGWHQDIDHSRRAHARNDERTHGSGTWYCPTCSRRTHL